MPATRSSTLMQLLHLEQQFSGPGPVVRGIEDEQGFILVVLHDVGLHVMDYHHCFVIFCVIVFTHLVLGGVSLTSSFNFFLISDAASREEL